MFTKTYKDLFLRKHMLKTDESKTEVFGQGVNGTDQWHIFRGNYCEAGWWCYSFVKVA